MALQAFLQEREYVAVLTAKGSHDGEDALDEAAAKLAVRAAAGLAPEHQSS